MKRFCELVEEELVSAKEMHPGDFNSPHEAYGVIQEEMHEFQVEVFLKPVQRNRVRMLKELVQIAAMAQRASEDLGLLED